MKNSGLIIITKLAKDYITLSWLFRKDYSAFNIEKKPIINLNEVADVRKI